MVEEDGGGWGGGWRRTEEGGVERVFWRPRSMNGEKGGREEGEPYIQGALVSNARKFTNLAPVSNFYYITATLVGWG